MQRDASPRPAGFLILGCATTATIAAVYATRRLMWGDARPAWDVTVPAFWPLLGAVLVAAWRPRHPGWLVAGALVATVPPVGVGFLSEFSDLILLGKIALTWSLPWGACIAAGAWLAKPLRRLAAVTVAAAPLLTMVLLTYPVLPGTQD
jgi:hypothetical protein